LLPNVVFDYGRVLTPEHIFLFEKEKHVDIDCEDDDNADGNSSSGFGWRALQFGCQWESDGNKSVN
jgi:hypothetical protein